MRTFRTTLIAAVLLGAAIPAAAADIENTDLSFVLRGPLHRGEPEKDRFDLHCEAFARDGVWGFVYGTALNFDNGEHIGRMEEFSLDEGTLSAKIHMRIMGDPWTEGGRADIRLSAKPAEAEDAWEGTYECTFLDKTVTGKVSLSLADPPQTPEGFKPVTPGERPRMLFRKHRLDELKAKLAMPSFGPAAKKRLTNATGDAIAMGLMHQLTGEKAWADKAWKAVKKEKADFGPGAFSLGHAWGPRITQIATAYDLCFEAWDDEKHAELATYFDQVIPMLYWQLRRITRKANWHPCSNYSGPMRGAGAIGSLAMWGIPGDKPDEPEKPQTHKKIAPDTEYEPSEGAPVHAYADATMPDDWIYVGGYRPRIGERPLDPAQVRPEVGGKVAYRGRKETWRHVSKEKDKGYWQTKGMMGGKPMIDITNAIGRVYDSTSYFYTVIRNDKSRWVRLRANYSPATFYLAGKKIEEGGYAKIDKGLYPLLVVAPIGRCEPWGRHLMQPKLIETTEEEAQAYLDERMGEHAETLKDWRYACKVWEARGKIDVRYLQWFHLGRRHMKRYYRQGIGTGGFQPETGSYSAISVREPMLYASMFHGMFGHGVTPEKDIELFCVRKLMPMIFHDDGKIVAQDINGTPKLELDHVQRGFPLVPERYKPALLWYWNRLTGADAEKTAPTLKGMTPFAFVRYPLMQEVGGPPVTPRSPGKVLPLTWQASTFGFFCFRNDWQGRNDFVFQLFAKAHPIGGWNHPNAGTIRLLGLGHVWATGPSSRGADRWQEPVVDLPADAISGGATGQVTHYEAQKNGSGAVTIDLTDLYAGKREGVRLYDRHGVRNPAGRGDTGITGLRAVAIDYSGKSGAPALLAVADKVRGAKQTLWRWQLPRTEALKVTIDEKNGAFVMDYGDASMRATFLSPRNIKLELVAGKRKYRIKAGSKGGQMTTRDVNAVYATGGEDYFVVFTVQRKDAPKVNVRGKGLDASAELGKQKVSFDGEKIIIGR